MRPIVTRQEALKQGLPRFFTGRPCTHGHVDEKYTNNEKCCECARIQTRSRKQRARNAAGASA